MGDKHIAGRGMPLHYHGRHLDPRFAGDETFDLTEFDPVSTDLHLIVDSAVINEPAEIIDAHGVTGPVQHRSRSALGAKRVGDEFAVRHLRQINVTARDPGSPYQ